MTKTEQWLSVDEIAKHLGISKETVYRWLERGKIPAHRVGRLWKFQASEVDEWVIRGAASEVSEKKACAGTCKKEKTARSSKREGACALGDPQKTIENKETERTITADIV